MDRSVAGRWILAGGGLLLLIGFVPLFINPHENMGLAETIRMNFGVWSVVALAVGAALVALGAFWIWAPAPDDEPRV